MIRRGRIEEVRIFLVVSDQNSQYLQIKFPYVQPPFDWNLYELANALQDLGMRRNITAVLGSNPLMWCWPRKAGGDGLSYPFGEGTGVWIHKVSIKLLISDHRSASSSAMAASGSVRQRGRRGGRFKFDQ
jgi:hypothetical protein